MCTKELYISYCTTLHAGLSYQASEGLLAGELGGWAGGLVHYALYEPGGVL
jgi:tetrahydromethanopterin S-methyltransferase subunit D